MIRCIRWLCFTSLIALLALVPTPPAISAQGDEPVDVRIAPQSQEVAVDQTAEVAVEVVDATAVYGTDIVVTYDPSAIEIVDSDPDRTGIQVGIGTFLDAGFVARNTVDSAEGRIHVAMTQFNPSEPKSGTGGLIVIKLRGKQAGATSPLTLVSARLVRRDGIEMATTPVSGQVTVAATAGAEPTNTPRPTQAPPTALPTATATVPTAPSPVTDRGQALSAATATSQPTQAPTNSARPAEPTSTSATVAVPLAPNSEPTSASTADEPVAPAGATPAEAHEAPGVATEPPAVDAEATVTDTSVEPAAVTSSTSVPSTAIPAESPGPPATTETSMALAQESLAPNTGEELANSPVAAPAPPSSDLASSANTEVLGAVGLAALLIAVAFVVWRQSQG